MTRVLDLLLNRDHLEAHDLTDRSLWLAARRTGLGGSDLVRVIHKPRELWREKTGRADGFTGNPLTRMGLALESHILAEWAVVEKAELIRPMPFLRDRERPWRCASLDALARMPGGRIVIVDAKYSTLDWQGQIPESAFLQMVWYMAVTGIHEAHIARMDFRGEIVSLDPISFDPAEADAYLEAADDLWQHVVDDREPDAGDGEAGVEALSDLRRKSLVPRMDASELMLAVESELAALEREAKAAEARAKALKDSIAEQMNMHGVQRIEFPDGARWTFKEKRGSPSWKEYALSIGGTEKGAEAFRGKGSAYVETKHAQAEEA
jgi:predicted phage-related endonuclease